jgi:hypothetical protein
VSGTELHVDEEGAPDATCLAVIDFGPNFTTSPSSRRWGTGPAWPCRSSGRHGKPGGNDRWIVERELPDVRNDRHAVRPITR